ncbi:MAG: GNAT family N-acetyltransferase [Acidimicrobiales bacterium]
MVVRRRLGVVLLLPDPVRTEVQGLRRAVGDGSLERIQPHVTLVPPVNVREDNLGDALAVLRSAAASVPEFLSLTLGPPASFLPDNPVLFLEVGGDLDGLHALRDRVFRGPLERTLTWPYVPHVTLADQAEVDRIGAAKAALRDYRADVAIRAVQLLEERDRRWEPTAEVRFGPAAVVGRGGLEVELAVSRELDPAAVAFADREWEQFDHREYGPAAQPVEPMAVVARRGGEVVGIGRGEIHRHNGTAHLSELIVAAAERGTGVGHMVLAAVEAEARSAGCARLTVHADPATPAIGFYRERGFVAEAQLPVWKFGRNFVRLVRHLT